MVSPKHTACLSREISELDLNAALRAVQEQDENGRHYTKDELLGLRLDALGPEGLKTPPYLTCPKPPPSTPATLDSVANSGALKEQDLNLQCPAEKKKKKKSSGKNKKAPSTGFEEFYADPPVTPDEHAEELSTYDPARPFTERIQTCIQRYRARRNMDSIRSNVLTKYLMLGGVESSVKMFSGGLDKDILENNNAAEILEIQASDFIRTNSKSSKYYDGSDGWVVDWEGVAKGFFCYRVPNMLPINSEQDVKSYCAVIRNFLNFVLHHAVCTEYTKEIMAARKVCDLAEKELWAITELPRMLPGDFNIAASTLYGGLYKEMSVENTQWAAEDPDSKEYAKTSKEISKSDAERIFKTVVAYAGTDELFDDIMKTDIRIIKTEERCYEIVAVKRPDLMTLTEYANAQVKALGVLQVKEWCGAMDFVSEDVSDDEAADLKAAQLAEAKSPVESFWLEDEILELFSIGMKLEVTVRELNVGIKFFDVVSGLYCSFHTLLENEKMRNWKDPVLCTRSGPTVEDPDIDERAFDAAMEGEMKDLEKVIPSKSDT